MRKAEDIATDVKRQIIDDPTIAGAAHILVFARKKGFGPFKKEEIHLTGIVHVDSDKKKAGEYAQRAAGELKVVNEIEVTPSK
jgi:osmotically-inducible protein OsmY